MKAKDYVIVTAISSYRMRYVMHRDDLQKKNPNQPINAIEWANDTVNAEECGEFSQEHMGEYIVDAVEMNEDDMLELFDKDNDYLSEWSKDQKLNLVRKSIDSDEVPVEQMYRAGDGVSQDDKTAVKSSRLAAKQGDAYAQYNMGVLYEKGQGVPQDHKTAVKWYRLAAEQGYAIAQSNLGFMYEKGRGVPQDHKTAVKWYRLSAEQGNVFAQYNLGWMYENGKGVPQDDKTAVKWWKLAAEQGDAKSQYNLDIILRRGEYE